MARKGAVTGADVPQGVDTEIRSLDVESLARMFDLAPGQLPLFALEKIASSDLRYRALMTEERDALIVRILRRINDKPTSVLDVSRQALWADVWDNHRAKATEGHFNAQSLEPAFVSGDPIVRVDGDFVRPLSVRMELDFYAIVRRILFHSWVKNSGSVFEFGCGSAFNIADLAEIFPHVRICGLDWAPGAVQLVDDIAAHRGFNMEGRLFNFFEPDEELEVPPDAAVFTFCALEQVGERFRRFTDFLIKKRPRVCVHLEPILEFYNPSSLIDVLAMSFHKERQYLSGFFTYLQRSAEAGAIRILDARRLRFGSLFHEGYSVVVWQPT